MACWLLNFTLYCPPPTPRCLSLNKTLVLQTLQLPSEILILAFESYLQGRRAKRTYLNAAYIHEENGGSGLNHQLETVRNGSAGGAAAPSRYTVISLDDENVAGKDEKEEEEEEDPWALPELKNTDTPWKGDDRG